MTVAPKPAQSPPSNVDQADVDFIAAGGAPRMPEPNAPSIADQRLNAGLQPLTPKMARDPEYRRRVDEMTMEKAQVDKEQAQEQIDQQKKTDLAIKQAKEEYNAKTMADAITQQQKSRDDQLKAKDLQDQKDYLDRLDRDAQSVAQTQLDAGRLYRNQSIFDRILGGIMHVMGAAASGSPGTGNTYVNSVNHNIARDLDIQKAELENKRAAITQRRGIYADMVKLYGDKDAARLAAQSHMKEMVANTYDSIAAKYKPDQLQNQGDTLATQLRKQAAEERFKANEMVSNQLKQERAAAAARAAAHAEKNSERRWTLEHEDVKHGQNMELEELKGALKDGDVSGIMSGIPKNLYGEAAKEMTLMRKRNAGEKAISDYENVLKKWDSMAAAQDMGTPGGSDLGNQKRLLESRFAQLLTVAGEHSENDYKRNVVPNFGKATDSKTDKSHRITQLRERNNTNNATPILDSYGKGATPASSQVPGAIGASVDTSDPYGGKYGPRVQ